MRASKADDRLAINKLLSYLFTRLGYLDGLGLAGPSTFKNLIEYFFFFSELAFGCNLDLNGTLCSHNFID